MSSRCQCPFSGPSDTILGCHRDPISSEKGWLDFAVRELSRVAAGKARGQEAVWRSQCKPNWWDCACPHPWKNPTANPKDCKDTLKVKFECLVQHLRKEGQLPREMEEEIRLWEADQKPEVFLMTSFSSLLGQASNLHTLVEDTCHRMEESGSSVDISILNDLQSCLTACVSKVESMKNSAGSKKQRVSVTRSAKCAGKKRVCSETESDVLPHPPCKRLRRSSPASSTLSSASTSPPSNSVQSPPSAIPCSPPPSVSPPPHVSDALRSVDPSKMLLAILQQQLLQKQVARASDATPSVCQNMKTQTSCKPGTRVIHPSMVKGGKRAKARRIDQGNVASAVDTTVGESLSACLSSTAPQHSVSNVVENAEFRDFLELDFGGNDEVSDCQFLNDCQFLDNLLQETSPAVSVNVTTTAAAPCSVNQSVPSQSPCFTGPSFARNNTLQRPNHDPFMGQSPSSECSDSSLSESYPLHFDVESLTAAERQAESEWTDGVVGTALGSGVGDISRGLQDTEVVSDSGYNSESSVATSHRSSLDSEGSSCSDLDSPDLEAYLNSL